MTLTDLEKNNYTDYLVENSLKGRPACVLRRLPFDGMKPTFKHRRPVSNMILSANNCNRNFDKPVQFPVATGQDCFNTNGIRSLRVGPPTLSGAMPKSGSFFLSQVNNDRPGSACEGTPSGLVTRTESWKFMAPPSLHESLTQSVRLRREQSRNQFPPKGK